MKRRTIFGLCVLCAFAMSAVAAQGALGSTTFTCGSGLGSKDFSDAHCKTNVGAGKGTFGHEAVPVGTVTKITATNGTTGGEKSTLKLKSTQSGVEVELLGTELSATGTGQNKEEGTEQSVHTTIIIIIVIEFAKPAGKGCKVKGGELKSNELLGSSKGLTNQVKYTPVTGSVFAEFTVEGCSITALNHVYKLEGSVTGTKEGTTTNFTHAATTEQKTLKLSGQTAGLEGSITTKGENGNGLVFT